jgi:hypothetical protein
MMSMERLNQYLTFRLTGFIAEPVRSKKKAPDCSGAFVQTMRAIV